METMNSSIKTQEIVDLIPNLKNKVVETTKEFQNYKEVLQFEKIEEKISNKKKFQRNVLRKKKKNTNFHKYETGREKERKKKNHKTVMKYERVRN